MQNVLNERVAELVAFNPHNFLNARSCSNHHNPWRTWSSTDRTVDKQFLQFFNEIFVIPETLRN